MSDSFVTQWTVCSTSGSFVHRTSQARILECVDFSFSRGSSNPGVKLLLLHWQVDSLPLSCQGSPCYFPIWCKLCWSLCMHACSVMSHCCDPMNCSPPDSTDHEIFQARILEWVAISFSSWSSQPRDQTCISYIGRWILYHWANREDLVITLSSVQSLSHVWLLATPWTAQPTRFLRPWDFPGKSTGVGCHCLLRLFSYTNLIMLRCVHACILSDVRHFVTPWTVAYQAPLSVGFFRQEYWSGFLSPGDIPNPGIEPNSCVSTALTDRFFITAPLSKQGSFLLFPVCWVLFIF